VWHSDMRAILRPRPDTGTLALSGGTAPGVFSVGAVVLATASTPGYNHMSQSLSELAAPGTPHPWIMSAGFVVFGLFASPLVPAFYRGLGRTFLAKTVAVLFAAFCMSSIVAGLAQTDPPHIPTTLEGLIHVAAAQSAGCLLLLTGFALILHSRHHSAWRAFPWFTTVVGVTAIVFVAMFVTGVNEAVSGAFQRVYLAATVIWVQGGAFWLWRTSSNKRDRGLQVAATADHLPMSKV
jgi:hypothetical protein